DYTKKAQAYNDKVNESFDTAKRQQLEQTAAHQQSLQDIQAQHAADVADAQAKFEAATQKETAARAVHEQKVTAARASQEQADAVNARREELQGLQQSLSESIRQKAQGVYADQRQALDARWDGLREKVGTETPTPIQGIIN